MSVDGSVRISSIFLRQNLCEATRGYETDIEFMAALTDWRARFGHHRAKTREKLWRQMRAAGGAERAAAKAATRWWPEAGKRAEWSVC